MLDVKKIGLLYGIAVTLVSSAFASPGYAPKIADEPVPPPAVEQRGDPVNTDLPKGYNYPASYKLNDSNDVFITGSFIYWQASADDFSISEFDNPGVILAETFLKTIPFPIYPSTGGKTVFLKPKFEPGFQLGLGYNSKFDDWSIYGQYTRLHFHHSKSFDAASGKHFVLNHDFPISINATQVNIGWRLNFDMGDLMLSRAFYLGRRVIMEPNVGFKLVWFKNVLSVNSFIPTTDPYYDVASGFDISNSINSVAEAKSWSVGPRFGFKTKWLLGEGFRIDGRAAFSALFTRYTVMKDSSNVPVSNEWQNHYNQVRPAAEAGLGFAWGTYFCNNEYHVDIVVDYDFLMFWDMSVVRAIDDSTTYGVKLSPTNITYQGPTFSLQFDF